MHFDEQDRRNRTLAVRVSDDEMKLLETMAADSDVPVSQFVRRALAVAVQHASVSARSATRHAATSKVA